MAERTRQVNQFGHTLTEDAARPMEHLLREARAQLDGAMDYTQFRHLVRAQAYIVRAGAMLLAAFDRIQIEIETRAEDAQP